MRQYWTLDSNDMEKLNNGEEVELPIPDIFSHVPGLRKIILIKEENFIRNRCMQEPIDKPRVTFDIPTERRLEDDRI